MQTKTVGISFMCDCKCVIVCVSVCVCVCVCVSMHVWVIVTYGCFYEVESGYERSVLGLAEMNINNSVHYFISVCVGDYSYGTKHHHYMSRRMNKDLICKHI